MALSCKIQRRTDAHLVQKDFLETFLTVLLEPAQRMKVTIPQTLEQQVAIIYDHQWTPKGRHSILLAT